MHVLFGGTRLLQYSGQGEKAPGAEDMFVCSVIRTGFDSSQVPTSPNPVPFARTLHIALTLYPLP